MIPTGPEVVLPLAGAAGGVAYLRHRLHQSPELPSDLPLPDPRKSPEGVFVIGRYQHTAATPMRRQGWKRVHLEAAWRPWDGGEQHSAFFGTTGAGKSVAAGLIAAVTGENWPGWDLFVGDGKGGNDFKWVNDSDLGVLCKTPASIATLLRETVAELDRRAKVLNTIRVPRRDMRGVERAVAPASMRVVPREIREEHYLRPRVVVLDELADLIRTEDRKTKPISGPLTELAIKARWVGIHLVALLQRSDVDFFGGSGFLGNLFRARALIGMTDSVAEQMAHGGGAAVWKELASAAGYEVDGLERAMRPAGRALISGMEQRPPSLVQIYRFDTDSRFMTWTDYTAAEAPTAPAPASPALIATPSHPASVASREAPVPFEEGDASSQTTPPRSGLALALARRRLALGVWRFVAVPTVTPLSRVPDLRGRVLERDGGLCACCRVRSPDWEAAHRRARMLRGDDSMANMMTLCRACHDVMTKAEQHMVAWRRRPWLWFRAAMMGASRFRGPGKMKRPAWFVLLVLALFVFGFAYREFVWHALAVFGLVTLGPPLFRHYLLPKFLRKSRPPGINAINDWDRKQESEQPGYAGARARGYYAWRRFWWHARYLPMDATGAYLAGVIVAAWMF